MSLSLKDIVEEILLRENVGPGPGDTIPMTHIYHDIYDWFVNPDNYPDFDPDMEYDPFLYANRKKAGKNIVDKELEGDMNKYRDWRRKTSTPKGRGVRRPTKPIEPT